MSGIPSWSRSGSRSYSGVPTAGKGSGVGLGEGDGDGDGAGAAGAGVGAGAGLISTDSATVFDLLPCLSTTLTDTASWPGEYGTV